MTVAGSNPVSTIFSAIFTVFTTKIGEYDLSMLIVQSNEFYRDDDCVQLRH